jgi:hypothetical protein
LQQCQRAGLADRLVGDWCKGTLRWRTYSCLTLLFAEPLAVHLDHEPPLRERAFNERTGKYTPDANDPDYLIYRTPEEHRIKTFVRGDHGQYPDVIRIKRAKKRERKKAKSKWRPKKTKFVTGVRSGWQRS